MMKTTKLRLKMRLTAVEIRVGDVVDCSEVNYIVDSIRRSECTNPHIPDVNENGGWVVLRGDSHDHYFKRFYGDVEEYFASPEETITVWR